MMQIPVSLGTVRQTDVCTSGMCKSVAVPAARYIVLLQKQEHPTFASYCITTFFID
jgi:hypothetical protein